MTQPKHAANKDLINRIKGLESTYLDCRDPGLRHAWKLLNDMHVTQMSKEKGGIVQGLGRESQCLRCSTVKHERFVVTKQGIEKIGQSYEYPEGYLMPGIPRGVKPSVVIYQEQYRRAMEKVAKAQRGQTERAS